jgi:hypothetical protein
MIDFAIGLLIGAGGVYLLLIDRIRDHKRFGQERVNDYIHAFNAGYETKNGYKPITQEKQENDIYVYDDQTLYELEMASKKQPEQPMEYAERWD